MALPKKMWKIFAQTSLPALYCDFKSPRHLDTFHNQMEKVMKIRMRMTRREKKVPPPPPPPPPPN
jgi:hypothetical protein